MLGFSKEQHVLDLIDEAIVQTSVLDTSGEGITSSLEQTKHLLTSPIGGKHNVPLALSAARWRVTGVEKYAVRRIVHDDKIDVRAMSILVHVRLICAEVIRILDFALNELRLARQRLHV